MDEGYIKFNCEWIKAEPFSNEQIAELNRCRNLLYEMGLIGVYREDGEEIGFGNISIRIGASNQFIVSGTQTGGIAELNQFHYTKVIEGDFDRNYLQCEGPIKASSESLTHLAIYQADSTVNAIIHTHHQKLWKQLLNQVPTTRPDIPYGTPEMAREIFRLFKETQVKKEKLLVMAGHQDGIIAFGDNLTEAYQHFLAIL